MENFFNAGPDDLSGGFSQTEMFRIRVLFYVVISTAIISFSAGMVFWGLYGNVIVNAIIKGGK